MQIGFGKHKGKEISDVMEIDPSYIVWAAGKGLVTVDKKTLAKTLDAQYEERCYIEAVFESEHGDWGDRD